MKSHNRKGGSALVVLLIIVLLAGIGYYIYNSISSQKALGDQSAATLLFPSRVSDSAKITIISPTEDQNLQIGKSYTIKWTGAERGVTQYPIYLVQGGGGSVKTISKLGVGSASSKSFTFTVPNLPLASDYRIQLGGTAVARSGAFSIVDPSKPKITVISPNGGEAMKVGTAYIIKWDSVGLKATDKVNISLQWEISDTTHNLMETSIATNVPNTGSYRWRVNDVVWNKKTFKWENNYSASVSAKDIASNSFKIQIRPAKGIFGMDYSDRAFTISHKDIPVASSSVAQSGVLLSGASAVLGYPVYSYGGGRITAYNATFSFTLTNTSNSDIYISKNPASVVALVKSPTTSSSTISAIVASSGALYGDTSTTYSVPAGNSRSFTLSGILSSPGSLAGYSSLGIAKIYYNSNSAISSGLEALYLGTAF